MLEEGPSDTESLQIRQNQQDKKKKRKKRKKKNNDKGGADQQQNEGHDTNEEMKQTEMNPKLGERFKHNIMASHDL